MKNFKIAIWLEDYNNLNRTSEPVRLGIPIARGLLTDSSNIRLMDELGQSRPLSVRPLCLWPDGSVKWLLVDFIADIRPLERIAFTLQKQESSADNFNCSNYTKIVLEQSSELFRVNTGYVQFEIPRNTFIPFGSVQLDDAKIISGKDSWIQLIDRDGIQYVPVIDRFILEEAGSLRSSLLADGRFVSAKSKSPVLFRSRLIFFAGLSAVRLEFQIRNPKAALHPGGLWDLGDPGSFFFKELAIHLYPQNEPQQLFWYTEMPGDIRSSDVGDWILYQDSSGGANWNSRNHIDYSKDVNVSFRGYRVHASQNGEHKLIAEGMRANPCVRLVTSSGWLAATVKDFWQNFPKALRFEDGHLGVALFPSESRSSFELQGGEQKRHIVLFDFGLPQHNTVIPLLQHPIHAWVDPGWVEETSALSFFVPQNEDPNKDYVKYITHVIEGPNSFINKREVIDEYGWRNFGDLYADHEAVNHQEPETLVSHYNNQYDFIYGALVHFLRTGDRRWYQLMDEAARHMVDIDIYHTDEDRSAFNHGLFWHTEHYKDAGTCTHRAYSRKNGHGASYGGGPSNEHIYTSGLLHYFYLTGDPESADAVLELANWVITLDDGARNLLVLFDEGPTGHASNTVNTLYHKPGRGAGNSINTLIDAYALCKNRRYFRKAEDLIQRCIHPQDNIAELKLDEPEYRWSYLAFLQVLGKYLDTKVELGETDYYFFYAKDSLLRYANWMVENEIPYMRVLHKVEIPTETWPAQDIRKCHVFHLATKYGPPDKQLIFCERADFFFDRCLNDLLSFNTAFLTRPMVILSVYGYVHSFFQKNRKVSMIFGPHRYDFGSPERFLPQKARFKAVFMKKLYIAAADIRRLSRAKWYEMRYRLFNRD